MRPVVYAILSADRIQFAIDIIAATMRARLRAPGQLIGAALAMVHFAILRVLQLVSVSIR